VELQGRGGTVSVRRAKDKDKTPANVRPYDCHGCDMREPPPGMSDWIGDCPFCGKEQHLYVEPTEGLFDCKVCGESGNVVSFLTRLADKLATDTPRRALRELSAQRGIPVGVLKK